MIGDSRLAVGGNAGLAGPMSNDLTIKQFKAGRMLGVARLLLKILMKIAATKASRIKETPQINNCSY